MLTHSRWAALRGSPSLVTSLGGTWHEVDASQPFGELFEAMASSNVVVGSLEDDRDAWRLMIAHAQAQWAHRVLLVEPSVIPPVVPLVDARVTQWEDLAETLRAHHRPYPRLEAALRDLEHEAVTRRPLIVAAEPGWWAETARPQFPEMDGVDELLEGLGLKLAQLDQDLHRLSTGERQRMALARAVIDDPPVILLDEPTGALDPESTTRVENLIKGLLKDGRVILFVSHDAAQIERLADRKFLIENGTVRGAPGGTERT